MSRLLSLVSFLGYMGSSIILYLSHKSRTVICGVVSGLGLRRLLSQVVSRPLFQPPGLGPGTVRL